MSRLLRPIFFFVLLLTLGLSMAFGGPIQKAAAVVPGQDPSITDPPGGISTGPTQQEGSTMTYTATIFNNGDTTVSGPLQLVVTLPQRVTYVSFTSTGGWASCTPSGTTPVVVTCDNP